MLWWVVASLVVVPLVLVALAAWGLRRRLRRLQQLEEETRQQGLAQAEALQTAQDDLHKRLVGVTVRAEALRRRVATLTNGRPPGR